MFIRIPNVPYVHFQESDPKAFQFIEKDEINFEGWISVW